MVKDAFYLPHDSNARNDQRILKVRYKHGAGGYGAFFMLLEIMRETSTYRLSMGDLEMIDEMEIHIGIDVLIDIVENYDLFEIEDGYFYSKSLDRRMQKMNDLRNIRSKAGRKGGQAKPKQTTSKPQAVKKKKEEEIKKSKDIKSLKSIDNNFLNELQSKNLDVDVHLQFGKFKDYLSAQGKTYKDYRAGFRNWITNGFCEKTDKIRNKIQAEKKNKERRERLNDDVEGYEEGQEEFNKAVDKLTKRMSV